MTRPPILLVAAHLLTLLVAAAMAAAARSLSTTSFMITPAAPLYRHTKTIIEIANNNSKWSLPHTNSSSRVAKPLQSIRTSCALPATRTRRLEAAAASRFFRGCSCLWCGTRIWRAVATTAAGALRGDLLLNSARHSSHVSAAVLVSRKHLSRSYCSPSNLNWPKGRASSRRLAT